LFTLFNKSVAEDKGAIVQHNMLRFMRIILYGGASSGGQARNITQRERLCDSGLYNTPFPRGKPDFYLAPDRGAIHPVSAIKRNDIGVGSNAVFTYMNLNKKLPNPGEYFVYQPQHHYHSYATQHLVKGF